MNVQLGDTEVSLGDVADAGKTATSLTKSLPGMATQAKEETGEPETCSQCSQKIVTSQPGNSVDAAVENADKAVNCCNKLFDCFGKGLDAADKVQEISGEA